MKKPAVLIAAITALAWTPLAANPPLAKKIDATFVTLDGAAFVKTASWRGKPTLVAFWDQYCAPCLGELQRLPMLVGNIPDWRIATVALGEVNGARRQLRKTPIKIGLILAASTEAAPLLRRFGNNSGALPYTVALSAEGKLCGTLSGPLTTEAVAAFKRACV
jgi:thiol-disulfide isomerase/thioredoxin